MNLKPILREWRRSIFEWAGNPKYSRPGLNDLDRKLSKYLTKRDGVFFEAGANDGFTQSNTYFLEKFMGWSGILVEGIPALYGKACKTRQRSRVFNCALVPSEQEGVEVEMIYGNLMSLVVGAMGTPEKDGVHIQQAKMHDPESGNFRVKVPGRTATSIIEECRIEKIDFMSLDVEGFEGPVLRGLDLNRFRPEFLCVEARNRAEVDSILADHYLLLEELSPMDVLYKARR